MHNEWAQPHSFRKAWSLTADYFAFFRGPDSSPGLRVHIHQAAWASYLRSLGLVDLIAS
jgi:hypothetical protein